MHSPVIHTVEVIGRKDRFLRFQKGIIHGGNKTFKNGNTGMGPLHTLKIQGR
jgi:hypothetical protein